MDIFWVCFADPATPPPPVPVVPPVVVVVVVAPVVAFAFVIFVVVVARLLATSLEDCGVLEGFAIEFEFPFPFPFPMPLRLPLSPPRVLTFSMPAAMFSIAALMPIRKRSPPPPLSIVRSASILSPSKMSLPFRARREGGREEGRERGRERGSGGREGERK